MDQVRVVISGAGAISPLGGSGDEILRGLAAGRRGLVRLHEIDPGRTGVFWAGALDFRPEDHFGDKNYRVIDRTGQLVLIAAGAALADGRMDPAAVAEREVGLVLGTLFGSVDTIASFDRRGIEAGPKYVKPLDFANSVINAAAGQAAIWFDLRGINSTVTGGGSAGIQAIAQAFDLIRAGHASALLAGGAEELSFEGLLGFQRSGLLAPADAETPPVAEPLGAGRQGFTLAEGAALLLLEEASAAEARGARPLGIVRGHGASFDPARFAEPVAAAAAIARAISIALADAGVEAAEIGLVVVSANGLPLLDRAEALALAKVFGDALPNLPFLAPKQGLGDTLGAGGALAAIAALAALHRGEAPAMPGLTLDPDLPALRPAAAPATLAFPRALVLGLGIDGGAAALVLEAAALEAAKEAA